MCLEFGLIVRGLWASGSQIIGGRTKKVKNDRDRDDRLRASLSNIYVYYKFVLWTTILGHQNPLYNKIQVLADSVNSPAHATIITILFTFACVCVRNVSHALSQNCANTFLIDWFITSISYILPMYHKKYFKCFLRHNTELLYDCFRSKLNFHPRFWIPSLKKFLNHSAGDNLSKTWTLWTNKKCQYEN